jgi:hypothetical protein
MGSERTESLAKPVVKLCQRVLEFLAARLDPRQGVAAWSRTMGCRSLPRDITWCSAPAKSIRSGLAIGASIAKPRDPRSA